MKITIVSLALVLIALPSRGESLEAEVAVDAPLIHVSAWGHIRIAGSDARTASVKLARTERGPTGESPRRPPFGLRLTGAKGVIWSDVAGDLEVVVPFRSRLVVHSYRWGNVEVRGICGDVEVTAHGGGVSLQGAGGAVVAHAGNGPIRTELAWAVPRPSSLTSMNGAIDIAIPAGAPVRPRLRTDEGTVQSVIPWEEGLRPSSARSDQVQLFAYTRFGAIRLEHAERQPRCP